jgi:hypothetical protein
MESVVNRFLSDFESSPVFTRKIVIELIEIARLEGKMEAVKESGKSQDQWKIGYYQRQIDRIIGKIPFKKIKNIEDVRDQSR